jgi:signal transduction histidine kinase
MPAEPVLTRFVDWWIPATLRGSFEQRQRARSLVGVLSICLGAALLMTVAHSAIDGFSAGAPSLGLSVALASGLVLLRTTGNYVLCAHLPVAAMAVTLAARIFQSYPIDGAALCLLSTVPFSAIVLLDRRAAWGWTAAAIALVVLGALVPNTYLGAHPVTRGIVVSRAVLLIAVLAAAAVFLAQQQARALAEFERLARAKSALMTTVTHELRSPMNGILGMADLMLAQHPPQSLREPLALLVQSGQTMVTLISDVLDLAKIEAGSLRLDAKETDLASLLDDTVRPWRKAAAEKHLEFLLARVSGVPATIFVDGERLQQVLGHLLSNAVKFTQRGAITLDVERLAPDDAPVGLRLTVRDTGTGMSAEVLRRVQQPFVQADTSSTRMAGGAGVGLVLCRELVRLMGGRLLLASLEARGTSITVELGMGVLTREASPR